MSFEKIIEEFQPQKTPLQCEATCILNTLNELGKRQISKFKELKMRDVKRICGWKEGLCCNEKMIVPLLNNFLKRYNYVWIDTNFQKREISKLLSICTSEEKSFPIISVPSNFVEYHGIKSIGKNTFDHAIIIFGMKNDLIHFYDPNEIYTRKPSLREGN
jgi:hypothetical protein